MATLFPVHEELDSHKLKKEQFSINVRDYHEENEKSTIASRTHSVLERVEQRRKQKFIMCNTTVLSWLNRQLLCF